MSTNEVQIVVRGGSCARPDARLPGSARITAGSGKLSLWGDRAKRLLRKPVSRRPLDRAGFGVQEECRQHISRRRQSRHRAAIFPFVSVKKSRLILLGDAGSVPLRASSVVRRVRSREKSGATPPHAAATWITGPVPLNGTPNARLGGHGPASWPPILLCVNMWRRAWPA